MIRDLIGPAPDGAPRFRDSRESIEMDPPEPRGLDDRHAP